MLNKNRSGRLARLKYLAALPLCAGMLCASTLAFAKDYGWVDLTPRETPKTAVVTDTIKPPPPTFLKEPFRGLNNYLKNNVEYPKAAFNKKLKGSVLLSFNLNNAGIIDNVKVIDDPGNGFAQPVVKYLSAYPLKIKSKAGNYKIGVDFNMVDGDYVSVFSNPKINGDKTFVGEINIVGMTDAQRMQTPPNPPSPAPRKITKKLPPPPAPPAPPVKKLDKVKFPPPPPTPPVKKLGEVSPATTGKIKNSKGLYSFIIPPAPAGTDKNTKVHMPPAAYDKAYVKLYNHMTQTISYPDAAIQSNTTGNVILSYRIDDSHKITDIKVMNSIGKGCDESAISALKSYNGTVEKAPGNYVLAAAFVLKGFSKKFETIGDIRFKPNFTGVVVVAANVI
jgi:outer membrane biosynthesis protein TonB